MNVKDCCEFPGQVIDGGNADPPDMSGLIANCVPAALSRHDGGVFNVTTTSVESPAARVCGVHAEMHVEQPAVKPASHVGHHVITSCGGTAKAAQPLFENEMYVSELAGWLVGFVKVKLCGVLEPPSQLNVDTLVNPAAGEMVNVIGEEQGGEEGVTRTVTTSLGAALAGAQTVRQFVPHAGHCATTLITLVAGAA
jgi:hypothetical protein